MPYVNCPTCDLSVFSAALVSSRDACPQCGTPLNGDSRSRRLSLLTQTARQLRAQRREPAARTPGGEPAHRARLEQRFREVAESFDAAG